MYFFRCVGTLEREFLLSVLLPSKDQAGVRFPAQGMTKSIAGATDKERPLGHSAKSLTRPVLKTKARRRFPTQAICPDRATQCYRYILLTIRTR